MPHKTRTNRAGDVVPTNDEAHDSPQIVGPKTIQILNADATSKLARVQVNPEEVSVFARLEQQFAMHGLSLYPLDGPTVLVVSQTLGMSRTLPDLRTAQIYLRQLGGAL